MRIAVLSDIHANYLALQAVLTDSRQHNVEEYWFLGDLIGYGPNPIEVVQWLMGTLDDYPAPKRWVMGNHDAMLVDLLLQGKTGVSDELLQDPLSDPLPPDPSLPDDLETLGDDVQPLDFVIREKDREGQKTGCDLYYGKSRGEFLTPLDWEGLKGVAPLVALELNRCELAKNNEVDNFWKEVFTPDRASPHETHLNGVDYVLVHSSQVDNMFRYLYAWHHEFLLAREFELLQEQAFNNGYPRIQLCGHTHVPTMVRGLSSQQDRSCDLEEVYILPGEKYSLTSDSEMLGLTLINPGSVGQPRDLDQRATYAILDTTELSIVFHRVEYDYQETARQLSLKYYPRSLRNRLVSSRPPSRTPPDWRRHFEKAQKVV